MNEKGRRRRRGRVERKKEIEGEKRWREGKS